ncbi:DUF2218 domain-containing protein [Falsiroseomonas sp.]|uniref:DUF2218 domain-containing protein n=1 Tax=Falsiroseomonas sp. TaxID=2870721 RepID=UPI003F718AFA
MLPFTSEAVIPLRDPAAVAARLVAHLAEHGLVFRPQGEALVAELPIGQGSLRVGVGELHLGAAATDARALQRLCLGMAEHVVEFAEGEAPEIRWAGLGAGTLLSDFRELRVQAVQDLAPRLRRLVLWGEDLARFDTAEALHVRLHIPPEGQGPAQWPRQAADGSLVWPAAALRPDRRAYTIRRVDVAAGLIEIDFVRHAHGGPGTRFAEQARPGDLCGITGPGGGGLHPAPWQLLMGDETALPAIARMLELLPRSTAGVAVIEVDGPADEIPLALPPGFTLRWLHRAPAAPGTASLLPAALADIDWPAAEDRFVWAACERQAAAQLREALAGLGISRQQSRVAAYWRHGQAEAD